MNNTKYNVAHNAAVKVTVTITRRQLWLNYVESWRDIAWDDCTGGVNSLANLKEVADVLLTGDPLDQKQLRKLFSDGWTFMLLGDAMEFLDVRNDVPRLREVVVTDDERNIVVPHEDINY